MNAVEKIKACADLGQPVVLWGASKNNVNLISALGGQEPLPICAIIDSDAGKWGRTFLNIPIMSFEEARVRWEGLHIWVAAASWKYQVIGRLVNEWNFPSGRILNYEPIAYKRACPFVETSLVCLTGGFEFCCLFSGRSKSPSVAYDGSFENTLRKWVAAREELRESIRLGEPTSCDGCMEIQEGYYPDEPRIEFINNSAGGICNLKCIYCRSGAKTSCGTWDTDVNFPALLALLKEKEMLSDSLHIDISPGEPTLHRDRKRIYDTFRYAQSASVMTNATVFDAELAECLRKGRANLCVSVDAGTRETFCRVRGADLFEKQRENLLRYSEIAPGAVDLKYIFVPGENDSLADAEGFAELCAEVRPSAAFLTYDIFNPVQTAPPQTVAAAQTMIAALEHEKIMWKINSEVLSAAGLGFTCR